MKNPEWRKKVRLLQETYKARWLIENPYDNLQPKRCSKCQEMLPRIKFYISRKSQEGLQPWCSPCRHARHANNPALQMLSNARSRAKRYNLEFNITLNDIVVPDMCPMLNIKLKVGIKAEDNSPSLDRIDNTLGYIKGNVHVISSKANTIKNVATIEDLEMILSYLRGTRQIHI